MPILSGLRSFVAGTKAKAEDVNFNFSKVEEAVNGLLQVGVIAATTDLTGKVAYQDVPGAILNVTPTRASRLLVWANFDFEADDLYGWTGTVNLDGVDQTRVALLDPSPSHFENISDLYKARQVVSAHYEFALSAAAHTVKLRAKSTAETTLKCSAANTAFLYLLLPDPA